MPTLEGGYSDLEMKRDSHVASEGLGWEAALHCVLGGLFCDPTVWLQTDPLHV